MAKNHQNQNQNQNQNQQQQQQKPNRNVVKDALDCLERRQFYERDFTEYVKIAPHYTSIMFWGGSMDALKEKTDAISGSKGSVKFEILNGPRYNSTGYTVRMSKNNGTQPFVLLNKA
jgi:hypothetical protein